MMYIKTCLFFPCNLLIFFHSSKILFYSFFSFHEVKQYLIHLGVEVNLRSKLGACLALKRQKTRSCLALYHSKASTT